MGLWLIAISSHFHHNQTFLLARSTSLAWISASIRISMAKQDVDSCHSNISSSCVLRSHRVYSWTNSNLHYVYCRQSTSLLNSPLCSEHNHCGLLYFSCSTAHALPCFVKELHCSYNPYCRMMYDAHILLYSYVINRL